MLANEETVVRVEQGEYAVIPLDQSIGTYDIIPCVAIYAVNNKMKLHGIAHIDGRTAIISVKTFFQKMGHGQEGNEIEVKLYGANSENLASSAYFSTLDDPHSNLKKVKSFLNSEKIKFTRIEPEDRVTNITIGSGEIKIDSRPGLSGPVQDHEYPLHILQGLRRKLDYKGLYPLVETQHEANTSAFLDKLALNRLTIYERSPEQFERPRGVDISGESDEAFNNAMPKVTGVWKETIEKIYNQINPNIDRAKNRGAIIPSMEEVVNILKTLPIYAGRDNMETQYNTEVIKRLKKAIESAKKGEDIKDVLEKSILCIRMSDYIYEFSLRDAIAVARRFDPCFNGQGLIKALADTYPKRYQDLSVLHGKEYGVEVEVDHFMNTSILNRASPRLAALVVLNGFIYGAEQREYTIVEAVDAACIANPNINKEYLLNTVVTDHNNRLRDYNEAALRHIVIKIGKDEEKNRIIRANIGDLTLALENITKNKQLPALPRQILCAINKGSISSVGDLLNNDQVNLFKNKHNINDNEILQELKNIKEGSQKEQLLSEQQLNYNGKSIYSVSLDNLNVAIKSCGGQLDSSILQSFNQLTITKELASLIEKPLIATKIAYVLTYCMSIGMLVGVGSCISNNNLKKNFVTSTAIMSVAFCVTKLKIPIISPVLEYSANKVQSFIDRTRSCVAKQEQLQRT